MKTHSLKTKITTPRFAETIAWYRELFGLDPVEQWDEPGDKGCILAFPGGRNEAFLEIYAGPAANFLGLSLQFRTADLDGFHAALAGRFESGGPVDRPWGSRYLYLTDPNGIAVIVYEGGL